MLDVLDARSLEEKLVSNAYFLYFVRARVRTARCSGDDNGSGDAENSDLKNELIREVARSSRGLQFCGNLFLFLFELFRAGLYILKDSSRRMSQTISLSLSPNQSSCDIDECCKLS